MDPLTNAMDTLTMDRLEMDRFTKNQKEKLLQIISDYPTELEDLECPFLWKLTAIKDRSDFKNYIIESPSDFDGVSDNCDSQQQLVNYGVNSIARLTYQYFAYGSKDALATLTSFNQTLIQESKVPNPGIIGALFYIARSCEVVLHLLDDQHVKGFELKESMRVIDDPEEIGHLEGIRGMLYLLFNTNEDSAPFFRRAIPATNRFYEYVYGLAKTIARKRRLKSSTGVVAEEIELFREVAENHTFAVPQLLCSLDASIRNMKRQHSPGVQELEKLYHTVLEDAWNRKEIFGSKGLTRIATEFKYKGQYSKAKELYEMVYDKNPSCGMNLHRYGIFLIKYERDVDAIKKGFEYLVRAGHIPAFTSLLDLYFKEDSIFERSDFFSDYLEQFVSFTHKDSYKRLYSYIAYKYFIIEGDFQKGVNYLKTAMNVNLDNLKFDFYKQFKTLYLSMLKNVLSRKDYKFPKTVDLSYDVGRWVHH